MELYKINDLSVYIDPDTGELIEDDKLLKELEENRQEKQKNLILYYKNLQAEEGIVQAEVDRLIKLKSIVQNKQKSMKYLLEKSMLTNQETEIDFTICKAKFKKNPPRLEIEVGADISQYIKVEMVEKTDKNAIKLDLKAGKEVKGCKLVSDTRLDII